MESEEGNGDNGDHAPAGVDGAPASAAGNPGRALPDRKKVRVLVMDDEELVREMAQRDPRAHGVRIGGSEGRRGGDPDVRRCGEGGEGVRPGHHGPDDPRRDGGKDASRKLLQMHPEARMIVSSGYSSDPVMADHLAYGFRGLLPKPYRVEDFTRVVRQVLAA